MNDLYFEDFAYGWPKWMPNTILDCREGLPGVYFYWFVSEVIEAPEDQPDTLVCSMEYDEDRIR